MEELNRLYGDIDIIMTAVNQDGKALEFASEDLQRNRDIVMAAVKQNGKVLDF